MIITVVPSYSSMSEKAADRVADTLAARPDSAITLPTGNTPLGLFKELIDRKDHGLVDLSRMHLFCLDEYAGVTSTDPHGLTSWLYQEFIRPVGLREEQVHPMPSAADDPDAAAALYEADLKALGGLELAVIGLGPNGHIAYNEPGSERDSRTRVLTLTQESLDQAAAYWHNTWTVPRQAMTIGVATLLEARKIVLIVSGASKGDILRRALREDPTADVPGSWLQLAADRLEVIVDEAAAQLL